MRCPYRQTSARCLREPVAVNAWFAMRRMRKICSESSIRICRKAKLFLRDRWDWQGRWPIAFLRSVGNLPRKSPCVIRLWHAGPATPERSGRLNELRALAGTDMIERARRDGIRILDFDPTQMRFDEELAADGQEVPLARISAIDLGNDTPPPKRIMASFTEAICQLLNKINPDGLGETAYHLLSRLGAKQLEVFSRHGEVIAYSRILGGALDGCPLVCKGGSVGSENAILEMLALLTSIRGRNV